MFPLPYFPPLQNRADFSTPAFSTPAESCRYFHSRFFPLPHFKRPPFFSVLKVKVCGSNNENMLLNKQEQQRVAVGPGNAQSMSIRQVASDAATPRRCTRGLLLQQQLLL